MPRPTEVKFDRHPEHQLHQSRRSTRSTAGRPCHRTLPLHDARGEFRRRLVTSCRRERTSRSRTKTQPISGVFSGRDRLPPVMRDPPQHRLLSWRRRWPQPNGRLPGLRHPQRGEPAEEAATRRPDCRSVGLEEEWLAHFATAGNPRPPTRPPEINLGPVAFREISEETVPIPWCSFVAAHVRILPHTEGVQGGDSTLHWHAALLVWSGPAGCHPWCARSFSRSAARVNRPSGVSADQNVQPLWSSRCQRRRSHLTGWSRSRPRRRSCRQGGRWLGTSSFHCAGT